MTNRMYLLKEGYDNLKKHSSKTFATMLIICATMLILGIFIILFQNINANVKIIKNEQGLQALLKDNVTEQEREYIEDSIKVIPGVKSVEYLDKDQAFEDAKEVFKDQLYILEGLDKIKPFPASYVVTFDDINQASEIKAKVEKIDGVYKVKYNETTIQAVISLTKVVNIFLLALGSIMLVVSIFIISNTIKLAVYSNKREIYIMRYIGATNSFIKTPFVVEGAIMGIISSLISFVTISLVYIVAYTRIPKFGTSMGAFGFLPYSSLWWQVLILFVVLGLVIGIVGSNMSMRKYLKV